MDFYPVVCVSASRHVRDGLERRTMGFAYVQGSGDDHELWGMVRDTSVLRHNLILSRVGSYTSALLEPPIRVNGGRAIRRGGLGPDNRLRSSTTCFSKA